MADGSFCFAVVQNLKTSWLFFSKVQRASLALQICICFTLAVECAWKHSVILCLITCCALFLKSDWLVVLLFLLK